MAETDNKKPCVGVGAPSGLHLATDEVSMREVSNATHPIDVTSLLHCDFPVTFSVDTDQTLFDRDTLS